MIDWDKVGIRMVVAMFIVALGLGVLWWGALFWKIGSVLIP